MAYRGIYGGKRVYDDLEDVPDPIIESGQVFVVLYPPEEVIEQNGVVMVEGSPFVTLFGLLAGVIACVFVTIGGYFLVQALQQHGYNMWGRPADVIDDNTLVLGDGSVVAREGPGEPWEVVKGGFLTPMVQVGIIAVLLIATVIILWVIFKPKIEEKLKEQKTKEGKDAEGKKG